MNVLCNLDIQHFLVNENEHIFHIKSNIINRILLVRGANIRCHIDQKKSSFANIIDFRSTSMLGDLARKKQHKISSRCRENVGS